MKFGLILGVMNRSGLAMCVSEIEQTSEMLSLVILQSLGKMERCLFNELNIHVFY